MAGCATSSGNYCDIAKGIYPSRQDVLTEGTKRQVVLNNTNYSRFCKKK